jgi:hypothetical protein
MAQLEGGATSLEELVFSVPVQPCEVDYRLEGGEVVLLGR